MNRTLDGGVFPPNTTLSVGATNGARGPVMVDGASRNGGSTPSSDPDDEPAEERMRRAEPSAPRGGATDRSTLRHRARGDLFAEQEREVAAAARPDAAVPPPVVEGRLPVRQAAPFSSAFVASATHAEHCCCRSPG